MLSALCYWKIICIILIGIILSDKAVEEIGE